MLTESQLWLQEFLTTNGPGRRLVSLRKGQRLFEKGSKFTHVHMVLKGHVRLFVPPKNNEICGPNRWLFEGLHELAHVHMQSAFALTDCTVIAIEASGFTELLLEHSVLHTKFMADMEDRVVEVKQNQEPADRRLARKLRSLCDGKDKAIDAGPQQLAVLINTSRKTADGLLNKFQAKGLVRKLRRGNYQVDAKALDKYLDDGADE